MDTSFRAIRSLSCYLRSEREVSLVTEFNHDFLEIIVLHDLPPFIEEYFDGSFREELCGDFSINVDATVLL